MGARRGKKGKSSRKMEYKKRWQQSPTLKEECWGSNSESDYHPEDVSRETDSSLSLVEEDNVDLSSGKDIEGSRG